mgnify:CR=1 FL=1
MGAGDDADFARRYGPTALVTGAAEGLGAAFAHAVAVRGLDVVLVDVQTEKARATADAIAREHGVRARAVACDLAAAGFLATLQAATRDDEVGLLVGCAGVGATGPFLETPVEVLRRAIAVNCTATLELVHHYARPMTERGRGGAVVVASNSAYAGTPFVANYAATKAYDLALGEALWYELAPHGVDVLAFAPQGTNTPGFRRGMPDLAPGEKREGIMLPEEAVAIALGALGRIASLRPDMPEDWSRKREGVVRAAGDFTRGLATSRG